jgi:hypothetical protein
MGIKLKGLLYSEQFGFATVVSPFFFDEFDDESIDSHWNLVSQATEGADGKILLVNTPLASSYIRQENITLGTTFFDVYVKLDNFIKPSGNGSTRDCLYLVRLRWGATRPRAYIGLRWDYSDDTFKVYFLAETTLGNTSQTYVDLLTSTAPEKLWVRFKYGFGDSYVRAYWTLSQPVGDEGWTEITTSPYHCTPQSGLANLDLQCQDTPTGAPIPSVAGSCKYDFFRGTFETPGPATTTSTTTTTT